MSDSKATTSNVEIPRPDAIPARLGTILVSHTAVDIYSAFVPPLIGVLQVRCDLKPEQAAWMLGIGSLMSGLSQPIGAWISDHTDSRLFGAVGLLIAGICLSCIGLANSFWTLLPIYSLGMIGVGIFHPIGASSMGQLSDMLPGRHRSLGVSVFFVFGMAGGITGSLIARQVTAAEGDVGFDLLRYALIPGVLLAVILHLAIRHVPHRHHEHHLIRFEDDELTRRWRMTALLYLSNAIRFTVNVTLIYLIVRWAEAFVAQRDPALSVVAVAKQGGEIAGTINAMLIVGMAIGGIIAGTLIPRGSEKWFLVLIPILFAPAVALMSEVPLWGVSICAMMAGVGFATMIPVSLGLAQRLLPHRTSLASGLMLGGAWAVAFVGPRSAEYCLSTLGLSLSDTYMIVAGLLVLSGLVCLPLNSRMLHKTVHAETH